MCVELLKNKKFFKLVCGAGNEDGESVKKCVFVYAKAGCKVFDISARKKILESAKEGANLADTNDIHYCVSIGIKGDPHISKASINNSVCIKCGNCARNCPNSAIYPPNMIDDKKCIGCGNCVALTESKVFDFNVNIYAKKDLCENDRVIVAQIG